MKQAFSIDEMITKAKAAMDEIDSYDQAQIDRLVKAIGKAAYDNAEAMARIAVEETGYGRTESKIIKNRRTAMAAWYFLKDKKSTGEVEVDEEKCLVKMAKPAGVVACITPTTNPSATVVVNCMHVLKGKNAAIVAPHPKSKLASKATVEILNNAIKDAGGPENLIQIIEEPSLDLTRELMSKADAVIATGGGAMVKAANSCGKPSFGVGQGNVQVVIDRDYTDYDHIAQGTVSNRSYDNGMPCTGEQAIFVSEEQKDSLIKSLEEHHCHYIEDPDTIDKFRNGIFTEKKIIRPDLFGQTAEKVAEIMGVDVPKGTEIILLKAERIAEDEILSKEILCPVIKIYTYQNFEDAVMAARKNLLMEGAGHSAVIYSNNDRNVALFSEKMPVCRVNVNVSAVFGSGSPYNSGMEPTMSNGCGFWGSNSISGPLTYRQLLNYTYVIREIPDVIPPTPEEVWGE